MFECLLEFLKEVIPGSKSYGNAVDGIFSEGVCLCQGGSFSHVRKGECNPFSVSVIRFLIDCEIELLHLVLGKGQA